MGTNAIAGGDRAVARGAGDASERQLETYFNVLSWVQRNRLPRRVVSLNDVVAMQGSLFVVSKPSASPEATVVDWLDAIAAEAKPPAIEVAPLPNGEWSRVRPADVVAVAARSQTLQLPNSAIRAWWDQLAASCQAGWLMLRIAQASQDDGYLTVGVQDAPLLPADPLQEGFEPLLRRIKEALKTGTTSPTWAVGIARDGAWSVGLDHHYLAALRHPTTHLGRVCAAMTWSSPTLPSD